MTVEQRNGMDEWKLRVTRTVIITQTRTNKSYPDMTAEQAKEYELQMDKNEKIQSFSESLQFADENDIEISEEVQIFPVVL